MLYLLLLLSLILCCVAAAQNTPPPQTNRPALLALPTPPPLPLSPVDTFRNILTMPEPERQKFLATLSPEKRQVVTFKLDEYKGMSAEEREKRLRDLQVRVWVRQFVKVPPTNRVERLAMLRPADRQLVEARLAEWDQLPADLQKEVLTNEAAIRSSVRSPDLRPGLPPLPPNRKMAPNLNHWRALPAPRRAEILKHFEAFFEEFTPAERVKIMAQHPDVAKKVSIASLTKEQRERYIAGFKSFTALTPAERQRFLVNAARWEEMTPEQRESWRALARKLTPPSTRPPMPPDRPGAAIRPAADHASADIPSR